MQVLSLVRAEEPASYLPPLSKAWVVVRMKLFDFLGIPEEDRRGNPHPWATMPIASRPPQCPHASVVYVRTRPGKKIHGCTCMDCGQKVGYVEARC